MLQHYMSYASCQPEKPEVKLYEPNENAFCVSVPFEAMTDPDTQTLNRRLAGTANPRTLTKPTIAPPSHDITVWRQNPSVEHSQINKKTLMIPNVAGFDVPANASGKDAGTAYMQSGMFVEAEIQNPLFNPIQPDLYTATDAYQPINSNLGISATPQFPNTTLETHIGENQIFFDTNQRSYVVREKPFELLPVREGFAPESKNASGAPKSDALSVQTLPQLDGMPICDARSDNNLQLGVHHPARSSALGPDDIYDGRFTGYGADNRSFTDKLLGAPRYYYDDVNAVRMPSYITRNKLDACLTPFGDAYGKLNAGHLSLAEIRPLAEQSWMANSLNYRTNLSKSLMRKRNEEMVQNRKAPKYTIYPA